ncbi:hypothetical protein E1258_27105 [Micromonospora sp. KC207]|uniref:hypothetical protein n=1 Tax=Micromonospora sp. KC207 TaxID=2530377 RepID=UPI00104B791B|nr:hypothetical protein [Micromonospora sp. KC207]TDC49520.1 hypothetical protein E1258_27105 [Micromonospora sp. KC207]
MTTYESDRKPGFWRRLWNRLTGRRPEARSEQPATATSPAASVPITPLTESIDAGTPLAIPAMGEAYDFQVQVEATWSAAVTDLDDLRTRADRHSESVRRAVRDVVWQVGRAFAPHRALDAERAMVEALPADFCFTDAGVSLRCQVKLRVRPDARVVDVLLAYSLMRVRADNVEAAAARWREILTGFTGQDVGDLVLPYAAQLTDKPFAASVTGLENARHQARTDLADVLDRAAKSHTRVGLFEFAESYEAALHAFRRSQGLPVGSGDDS